VERNIKITLRCSEKKISSFKNDKEVMGLKDQRGGGRRKTAEVIEKETKKRLYYW